MASLGAFGPSDLPVDAPADEGVEPDTFDWFEHKSEPPNSDGSPAGPGPIRVKTDVNEIELIDFVDLARNVEADGLAGLAALKDAFRMTIDERDFDRFWLTARRRNVGTETLSRVFEVLIGGATSRPTQQPSDSSSGRLPTDASSPAASPSPASPGEPALPGRPDLQIMKEDAARSRAELARRLAG